MRNLFQRESRVEEYKKRIRHSYSSRVYNTASWIADKLNISCLLFNKVNVEGIENIRAVKNEQIFYVSNHLSLADFLVQGYIFYKESLPIPRFIAGENLNKFPFGKFWKKCGAYYLDRDSLNNLEYMKVYDEEIKNGLRKRENLLVYVEGGRNYSGKGLMKIQSGAIGQVVDIVGEGNNIWAVPCFIDYDKRIEENVLEQVKKYKQELKQLKQNIKDFKKQGKKINEFITNLRFQRKDKFHFSWDVYAYIKRIFDNNKGEVYLNFGKAFSIKDFLEDVKNNDKGKRKKLILTERIEYELKNLKGRYGISIS